jgi:hypothetical protein
VAINGTATATVVVNGTSSGSVQTQNLAAAAGFSAFFQGTVVAHAADDTGAAGDTNNAPANATANATVAAECESAINATGDFFTAKFCLENPQDGSNVTYTRLDDTGEDDLLNCITILDLKFLNDHLNSATNC